MRQGEIWYADLEPVEGSEQGGKRPIVIVSGNIMNSILPVVMICPLNSKIKDIKGCVVIQKSNDNKLTKDSEVLVFQIRTMSRSRLTKRIGSISENQINKIKAGINLYLDY